MSDQQHIAHPRRFQRASRLLTAAAFQAVFSSPDVKAGTKDILLLARCNTNNGARLGLVIGKKAIRLACQRNRVKRIIRESFRMRTLTHSVDVIVLAKRGLDKRDNQALHRLLTQNWQQLQRKLGHHTVNSCAEPVS